MMAMDRWPLSHALLRPPPRAVFSKPLQVTDQFCKVFIGLRFPGFALFAWVFLSSCSQLFV